MKIVAKKAVIKAGETKTTIGVVLIGDQNPEADETFELVLTNPKGIAFPPGMTEIVKSRTIVDDDK